MITLDPQQWRTLTAIQAHIKTHGHPLSLWDLTVALNLRSQREAWVRVDALARTGAIYWRPGRARTIQVARGRVVALVTGCEAHP